ncbi:MULTISPECIES: hypothetical protein [unclassified Bradyrhizobium]|uniref:hypothetical protein n=1 Tax=unclassified Bradyrhizobium TaxID=2631580 RepID=UPI001CD45F2F|nr:MULTISPECIES: hypothetical protein [unclassified Bradyrhizobium]
MQRLATWLATCLATSIALLAIAPTAQAGAYTFSIGGNRFHVEAPRNCRSASCITVASRRSLRSTDDVGMARAAAGAHADGPGAAAGLSDGSGQAAPSGCGGAGTGASRACRGDVAARCTAAGAKLGDFETGDVEARSAAG